MKYEILGIVAWLMTYSILKAVCDIWVNPDYWFFIGCVAGLLCVAIGKIVDQIRKEERDE